MTASARRPLRIAFDLDGVVADLDAVLRRQAAILFGDGMAVSTLTRRQRRQLWKSLESMANLWESLEETEPGAVAQLGALAASRHWETIFLTTRPRTAGAQTQTQSQRWLIAHGFTYPSVYVVQRSRGAIAAALDLDVVVDDRLEGCLDVISESSARTILVWRRATDVPDIGVNRARVDVVRTFAESLDRLEEIDRPSAVEPSGLDRFLRALGLKSASAA
jgi:hypothetical protein